MEQNCLSCRNEFKFFDGECESIYEPKVFMVSVKTDNDCCEKYDAVDKTSYDERVAWNKRQELEKENLKK